jgi:2-iminobutanoate/2-iminopropanoate deaminase
MPADAGHRPRVAGCIRSPHPSRLAAMSKPLGPYTPVVRAGDWIIVSGQLGIADGALVAGGVAAQTAQAVRNLEAQLATMGATLADIAKTLCFLTDMDTFATFNEAYVAGFQQARPARSTIGVASLPFGGAVEIEAWAYKPLTD